MANCPNCGELVSDGSKFCTKCGTPINATPIDNSIEYEIKGGNLPFVEMNLKRGQKIICESGSMAWRDPSITMETTSNGGASKALSRLFSGERLFQNIFTATQDNSKIAFSSSFPGTIMALDVKPGQDIICQKRSFLAGTAGVDLSIHFNQRMGIGFFGGEGFIMQRLSGNGKVFIEIDGSTEEIVLKEGEKIVLSTGHLVLMDSTCQIDIEQNTGLKNILLSGEGFFNTIITGPGRIVTQSMPISKTANMLYDYMPHPSNTSTK